MGAQGPRRASKSCRQSPSKHFQPMTAQRGSTRLFQRSSHHSRPQAASQASSRLRSSSGDAGWLINGSLTQDTAGNGRQSPKCDMRCKARAASHGAGFVTRAERGTRAIHYRISGYRRLPTRHCTPTGKMALIRREDTFTLAPWTPALETYKGRMVIGSVGPTRTTWSLDRGRGLARGIS